MPVAAVAYVEAPLFQLKVVVLGPQFFSFLLGQLKSEAGQQQTNPSAVF